MLSAVPRQNRVALGVAMFLILAAVTASADSAEGVVPGTNGQIVFASDRNINEQIWVMNDDENDRLLPESPTWSPDGTRIPFQTARDLNTEIYVMNADGTSETNITNHPADDRAPDRVVCTQHPFGDVPAWVTDAVDWAHCGTYIDGFPGDLFKPDTPISRGQVTRMLFRVEGSPPGSPANTFADVPNWVDDAVDWITDPNRTPPYASGYPGNTFRPNNNITRAENTRMVCRINTTAGTC